MKHRYITVILTGAVAEAATCILLWKMTELPVQDIVFLAALAYFAGIAAASFWKPRKQRKRRDAPAMITLDPVEWYTGKIRR